MIIVDMNATPNLLPGQKTVLIKSLVDACFQDVINLDDWFKIMKTIEAAYNRSRNESSDEGI